MRLDKYIFECAEQRNTNLFTMSSGSITPLGSPLRASTPKAPKRPSLLKRRGRLENIPPLIFPEERAEWQILAESGRVRDKFLTWTPEHIRKISDVESLEEIRRLYHLPSSQPWNAFEEAYMKCIVDSVCDRLIEL